MDNAPENLAETIVEAAATTAAHIPRSKKKPHNEEVQKLFDERRQEIDPVLRKSLSKAIWKALRRQRRQRADEEFEVLANKGSGLNKLRQALQKRAGIARTIGMRDKDEIY